MSFSGKLCNDNNMRKETTMTNEFNVTKTYNNIEGPLTIGFVQTDVANDYYFFWKGEFDGPYADEGECFGGWYRQHQT